MVMRLMKVEMVLRSFLPNHVTEGLLQLEDDEMEAGDSFSGDATAPAPGSAPYQIGVDVVVVSILEDLLCSSAYATLADV